MNPAAWSLPTRHTRIALLGGLLFLVSIWLMGLVVLTPAAGWHDGAQPPLATVLWGTLGVNALVLLSLLWLVFRAHLPLRDLVQTLQQKIREGRDFEPLPGSPVDVQALATSYNTLLKQFHLRESAIKAGHDFQLSVLDSVAAEVAVIDRDGVIVAVNSKWIQFARDNAACPGEDPAGTMVGSNYFAV